MPSTSSNRLVLAVCGVAVLGYTHLLAKLDPKCGHDATRDPSADLRAPVQRWLLQHKLGLTGLLPMLGEMGVLQPEDILDLSAADRARISASLRSLNLARWSRAVEGLAVAGQTGSVRTEGARTGTSEAAVGGPRLRSRPQALGPGPWDLGSRGSGAGLTV